jgi:hypothetical protein
LLLGLGLPVATHGCPGEGVDVAASVFCLQELMRAEACAGRKTKEACKAREPRAATQATDWLPLPPCCCVSLPLPRLLLLLLSRLRRGSLLIVV